VNNKIKFGVAGIDHVGPQLLFSLAQHFISCGNKLS